MPITDNHTNYTTLEHNILASVGGMRDVERSAFEWALARGTSVLQAERIAYTMTRVASLVDLAIASDAGGLPLSNDQRNDLVMYMRGVYTRAVKDGRIAS